MTLNTRSGSLGIDGVCHARAAARCRPAPARQRPYSVGSRTHWRRTRRTDRMTTDTHTHYYEPRLGHGLPHDPFNAIVGPRPIGWISSHDGHGHVNLAPYSFFNAFNYTPPIIGFSSIGYKDTVRNIHATGEFVWNLVTRELAEAMNATCAAVAPEVDEFELAGLTPAPSRLVAVPRVAESPVAFECRVSQTLQLQGADGVAVPSWLTLGEVVAVHIARALLSDGVYDTAAAHPVLRGGGAADYFEIGAAQRFRMFRPR
jgi:flavin reductase (DIM6/NTAB) family NADH-FMN oxidoreductase RutF